MSDSVSRLSQYSQLRANRAFEYAMSIELDEVVAQDVSDDALEQAAGGAQWGLNPVVSGMFSRSHCSL